MKVLIWFILPDPIVRTKGRFISGSGVCDCETYIWPHVQVVPTLGRSGENLVRGNSWRVGLLFARKFKSQLI
jgi:hypothetical protein